MSAPNGMLSMSLDQIIQQRQKDHKSSKPAKKLTPVKAASQHNNKKAGGKFNRNLKNVSHTTDDSEAVQISRPLKVITIERPKVVNPTSSVFSRLGNAGTYVLFKNLKRSVEEADITELCNVIGEVKDVKLIRDFQGVGSAKVCFDSSKTANECVKKYNGKCNKILTI